MDSYTARQPALGDGPGAVRAQFRVRTRAYLFPTGTSVGLHRHRRRSHRANPTRPVPPDTSLSVPPLLGYFQHGRWKVTLSEVGQILTVGCRPPHASIPPPSTGSTRRRTGSPRSRFSCFRTDAGTVTRVPKVVQLGTCGCNPPVQSLSVTYLLLPCRIRRSHRPPTYRGRSSEVGFVSCHESAYLPMWLPVPEHGTVSNERLRLMGR